MGGPVSGSGSSFRPLRNRLGDAFSPYLRQHAHNPVAWQPWGEEAIERARAEDRVIFVSIGYAACHWCHVMERESFDDPKVANLVNAWFVPVKVDREERPDVDALYMDTVLAMGVPGGWPLNLWLTPELAPLHGATYLPPHPRGDQPSFLDLCATLAEQWARQRERTRSYARANLDLVHRRTPEPVERLVEPRKAWVRALDDLSGAFDKYNGGFGYGTKFPQPPVLRLLLDASKRFRGALSPGVRALGENAHAMLELTIGGMDRGGIHDHLGGGFHRYSVDPEWEVPHFEKMLHDNAQLIELFAEGALAGLGARWAELAVDVGGYLVRRLRDPQSGLFASSEDADTGGREGETYLWSRDEVERVLLDSGLDPRPFFLAYRVQGSGTLLRHQGEGQGLERWIEALRVARDGRPQPFRDDKHVVAWNAMALSGFARLSLAEPKGPWAGIAGSLAAALAALIGEGDRVPRHDGPLSPEGVLADHALLARAFLDQHEADGQWLWVEVARRVTERMLGYFSAPDGSLLAQSRASQDLPVRRPEWGEGDSPDANAVAADVLLRWSALTAPFARPDIVPAILRAGGLILERAPAGVPTLVRIHDAAAEGPRSVVVTGTPGDPLAAELLRQAALHRPLGTAVVRHPGSCAPPWPVFAHKEDSGPARAWPCRGTWCERPIDDPAALAKALRAG